MQEFKVGTLLDVDGLTCRVIGMIEYANTRDAGKRWTEYRLKTNQGEKWLSIDDEYKEYSLSWPANDIRGNIGPEWHQVDTGFEVVKRCSGDVNVENGDGAEFKEYEDATEERTLSVEIWDDGTEFSYGYYLKPHQIRVIGYRKPPIRKGSNMSYVWVGIWCLIVFGPMLWSVVSGIISSNKKMASYIKKNSSLYVYQTSITGKEKQKADVYEYKDASNTGRKTDDVAKDLIRAVDGNTEKVTQKDDMANNEIGIVTKSEYALVYHPEDDPTRVYVQVSDRKYNYSSDNEPYHSSITTTLWYRSHYYSTAYTKDARSFSKTPSAYSSYNGTVLHNVGNGYFDTYAGSIKQASVRSRSSSGGGLSSGK